MAYKPSKKPKAAKANPEHDLQVAFIAWFKMQFPKIKIYATPNAARRSPRLGAYMRAEGLLKGVADITILHPSCTHHLLFIEFKIGKNKPTPEQLGFIAYANKLNYLAVVCYDFESAVSVAQDHLKDYRQ